MGNGDPDIYCDCTNRAAKRKTSGSHHQNPPEPTLKRRAVLGEVTNSVDVLLIQKPNLGIQKLHTSKIQNVNNDQQPEKNFVDNTCLNLDKSTFSSSLYKHLRALEMDVDKRPLPNYMSKIQQSVTESMREILIDWLVEVAEEYKLVTDTIFLTVSYIDRFLSANAIDKTKLQLLGVSAMLIASKHEEISPPHAEDFCYITDNTYTMQEVLNMEGEVLQFLNFEMGSPTAKVFLRIFTRAAQENSTPSLQFEFLASYLAELSLLECGFVQFLPSVVAASAVFLSGFTMHPEIHPWNISLQLYTGYRPVDLRACVHAMHDLQLNVKGSPLSAVRDKYKQQKFKCVADLLSPSVIPARYLESIYD